MISSILGLKVKQTQVFDKNGKRQPATVINSANLAVVSVKNEAKNGYSAVLLGVGKKRKKHCKKPELGILKDYFKALSPPRYVKEIKTDMKETDSGIYKPGSYLNILDILKVGDKVKVSGTSKGKGFQGAVKRYHFKGGPRTHGQSDRERAPGSIGQTTTPGRVYKGKRMAGRMGGDTVTLKNLEVLEIDPEKGKVVIKGLVPGGRNSLLVIRKV